MVKGKGDGQKQRRWSKAKAMVESKGDGQRQRRWSKAKAMFKGKTNSIKLIFVIFADYMLYVNFYIKNL